MERDNELLAGILQKGTRAFAGYAANELLQRLPEAGDGFGPDSFAGWQNWLAGTLEELAAAIGVGSPRSFVLHVRWAKAVLAARGISSEHCREGLACIRNVLNAELPEQVRESAIDYVDRALRAYDEQADDVSPRLLRDTPDGRLASEYLLALLEGDRRRATQLVLDVVGQGRNVRELYLNVLLPAQAEIGQMWLANEISVAEEHFTSATTRTVLARLAALADCVPRNGKTVVVAAAAGNQHDIGLQAVADFFEMDGWRTVHLGANVPVGDVAQAVVHFEAHLLGLSASQTPQLQAIGKTIDVVREAATTSPPRILVGGLAFAGSPELAEQLGADAYATDPLDAVAKGRLLVGLDRV